MKEYLVIPKEGTAFKFYSEDKAFIEGNVYLLIDGNQYILKDNTFTIHIDWKEELEKCKDPVYFYENYFLVNGKKPYPLTDEMKDNMRKYNNENKETS